MCYSFSILNCLLCIMNQSNLPLVNGKYVIGIGLAVVVVVVVVVVAV
jgi:hypothetical protein